MKFLCDSEKFIASIANGPDRQAAQEHFERYPMRCVLVSLPDAKTHSQNSLIWRDYTIVARLLFCNKEDVYNSLRVDPSFQDLFLVETVSVLTGEVHLRYRGLSELDKTETSEFITRYREFLQSIVDNRYGEATLIEWSSIENLLRKKETICHKLKTS